MIARFLQIISVCLLCFTFSCSNQPSSSAGNAIQDSVLTTAYPNLYEAVFSRNAEQILPFTKHDDTQIRRQAWRALAQTPVDSVSSLINKIKKDATEEAWFALSLHELSGEQLRDLESHWSDHPSQRAGISLVLGQQGDEQTLSFLMNHSDTISGSKYEQEGALAISRLIIRSEATDQQKLQIINAAFSGNNANIIRPWLYGFYRGDEMISLALKDTLAKKWKSLGVGVDAEVDQYIAKIIGAPVFAEIVQHYSSSGKLNEHVQLGIELAQLVIALDITEENRNDIKTLMVHTNPHVVQQTLANLSGNIQSGDSLYSFVRKQIIDDEQTPPFVWLQALNTLAETDGDLVQANGSRIESISKNNPYLYPYVLDVWMKAESGDAFLDRIEQTVEEGDPLKSMYAINALDEYWLDVENKSETKPKIREIIFNALAMADRGVTFSTQSLLRKPELFTKNDFSAINRYLNNFQLPGDIEVYQTFGSLYKERFEQQARPVIDSLSALGYVPLNRSLKQAGWQVEVPEATDTEFRTPDWNRLWELGKHPVWVLETEKGTIKVRMNTLSAPTTISAIDSLTQSGAYNDVPFHRVVPNFVIQGGDIERRDGFGGPDFTIPTEASEQGFVRGAAGIASAGPDTEGSQYFFMHQWKPHLNGGYTLFGNVIEGMVVVDRIVVGDAVKRVHWE